MGQVDALPAGAAQFAAGFLAAPEPVKLLQPLAFRQSIQAAVFISAENLPCKRSGITRRINNFDIKPKTGFRADGTGGP